MGNRADMVEPLTDDALLVLVRLLERGAERSEAASALCTAVAGSALSAAVFAAAAEPPLAACGPAAEALRQATGSALLQRAIGGEGVTWCRGNAPDEPWLADLGGGLAVGGPDAVLLVVGPDATGWTEVTPERLELLSRLLSLALAEQPGDGPANLDLDEREALLAVHQAANAIDGCQRAVDAMRRLFAPDWVLVARSDVLGARFVLSGSESGAVADVDVPLLAACSRDLEPSEGAVDPRAGDWLSRQLRTAGIALSRVVSVDFMGERFGVLQIGYRHHAAIGADVRRQLGRLAFHLALTLRQDALRQAQEEALRRLREAQEQAAEGARFRALAQMAGGVAHEFNNALGGILGRAQMLQRQTNDVRVQKGLSTILEIGFRAADTVKQLQEFTRERAAEEFTALSVAELWERLSAGARQRAEAFGAASGQRYALEVTSGELAGQVLANPDDLEVALLNVVTNALEATHGGGVVALDGRSDARGFQLTVVDRGRGMTSDERESCFDPFFSTKAQTGVGLGLSVAYGIVSRHHGEIEIVSQPGQGTTVTILVPRLAEAEPARSEQARILVIDDEAALCEVLSELFTGAGHLVDACSGGREGIELLQQRGYHLVCTDLKTADLSGWEVARAAKAGRPSLPVLLLTGFRDQLRPQDIAESGVDLVLGKPFTLKQVLDAAEKLLAGEREGEVA